MSDARCGYPRPTVIPKCGRARTSWESNRVILALEDDGDDDDAQCFGLLDNIPVPWTRRMLRTGGPCAAPIEAHCE